MIRKIALWIVLILIFTIPWETAITISSLGTLTRLIGFGAAAIWVASVLITGKLRKFHIYHIVVLSFMLFNIASIFWTVNYDRTITRIKTYTQLAVLIWILWDLLASPGSLRLAMQVFIFGAYLTIASQLLNLSSGQIISMYEQGRYSGAGQNANELSLILSLSIPLAWHLATTQESGGGTIILKVINYTFIPLAILSTILTASRTALVTDIPSIFFIMGTIRKIKPVHRVLIILIVFIAFVVAWPFIPQATFDRLSTFGDSVAENDLGGRTRLWKESFEIFLDHPVLGIGSDTLSAPGQLGAFAHNTFLSILAELGMVGFLMFLGILCIVIYQAIKQPTSYSILWITVIAVWLIGVFTLTWEYTKPTWFFLSLVIISAGIFTQNDKSPGNSPNSIVSFVEPNAPAS